MRVALITACYGASIETGLVTAQTAAASPLGQMDTVINNQSPIDISNPFEATRTTLKRMLNQDSVVDDAFLLWDIFAHDLSNSYDGFSGIVVAGGAGSAGVITGTVQVYGLRES
jgi:hypothetical protein